MNTVRLFLILMLFCAAISRIEAHAFLDHSDPRVGSTLSASPVAVSVWLTEELEGAFSSLQVFDARGTEVDQRDVNVTGAMMTVSIPKLAPGIYRVEWKAVSTDTHKTSGAFTFTIQ